MKRSHPYPGFLIAIEGIDGAGKTTQAHHLQSYLQNNRKQEVVRTKEPTTRQWGQILRDSAVTGRLSAKEEMELFIKDRREHVETVIKPSLLAGLVVIVDRYYFSSMAYQGCRGIDPEEIRRLNEEFAPEPDLLVYLDIDPKMGLERIKTRGDRANHFENTGTLKKAREIFMGINKPYLYKIDALQNAENITKLIVNELTVRMVDVVADSGVSPKDKLEKTLNLFGGKLES